MKQSSATDRRPLGRPKWLCAALILILASALQAQTPIRERISFNDNWRFAKGDPNDAGDKLSYANIRDWVLATGVSFTKDPNFAGKQRPQGNLGADVAYTQAEFDDRDWRSLSLPHDWGIEGPFDPKAPGGTDMMRTAGPAAKLLARADRNVIVADGRDLSFITVVIVDEDEVLTPYAKNRVRFSVEGPGEIVATDNGDPTSFESFQSKERNAFNGLCLVIVCAKPGHRGTITLKAESEGLKETEVVLRSEVTK